MAARRSISALSLACLCSPVVADPRTVVVQTPLGAARGVNYGSFLAFKGLPYAEAPKRFEPPIPKMPWGSNVTLDATRFGDACMHSGGHEDAEALESYGESEDCLYANVWVPKGLRKALPVVVWIHGGGFMMRTANFAGYWGDGFVTSAQRPTILVTFNYRLGVFGFYSSEDAGGNFGFQDQQELLRWVSRNIAAFGGDPSRVTLAGQSAGAMSVVCHVAAPGSSGLFHRAFASSPVGLHYRSPEENSVFGATVASGVGCPQGQDRTACLRSRPALDLKVADLVPEYLLHLTGSCPTCDNILPWMPIVDGQLLPRQPLEQIRLGLHNHVPMVVSTTSNETLAFLPTLVMDMADMPFAFNTAMDHFFDSRSEDVRNHYAVAPDTAGLQRSKVLGVATTDALMTCYARFMVRLLSQHANASLSLFALAPHTSEMDADKFCVEGPPSGAACHAGDVSFFLPASARMYERTKVGYQTPGEQSFGKSYREAVLAFVHSEEGPFEPYSLDEDICISWDTAGVRRTRGYHQAHCDFLETLGFAESPWGAGAAAAARFLDPRLLHA